MKLDLHWNMRKNGTHVHAIACEYAPCDRQGFQWPQFPRLDRTSSFPRTSPRRSLRMPAPIQNSHIILNFPKLCGFDIFMTNSHTVYSYGYDYGFAKTGRTTEHFLRSIRVRIESEGYRLDNFRSHAFVKNLETRRKKVELHWKLSLFVLSLTQSLRQN